MYRVNISASIHVHDDPKGFEVIATGSGPGHAVIRIGYASLFIESVDAMDKLIQAAMEARAMLAARDAASRG